MLVATPEFRVARTLFLSAVEADQNPELVFLLWELYGCNPVRFTQTLSILRIHQSTPGSVLSSPKLLGKNTVTPGLGDLETCIRSTIGDQRQQPSGVATLDMELKFLRSLLDEMTNLRQTIEEEVGQFGMVHIPMPSTLAC
jgi:hypothetical protein